MNDSLKFGTNLDSGSAWEEIANQYASVMENDYHRHRLTVIRALIPDELFARGRRIFDFGCGDAVHFGEFLAHGAQIEGVDISQEMIVEANKRLQREGHAADLARVGGVEAMVEVETASQDAVLCFNTLAYLTAEEEETFYREAARMLKPGGFLIVTHSNELFDLFALNRGTVEFFKTHLVADDFSSERIGNLLSPENRVAGPTSYNVRENPLAYRHKLAAYGLEEVQQEFINLHPAPPALLWDKDRLAELRANQPSNYGNLQTYHKPYPETLGWPESERWKLLFTCSTFGSRSRTALTANA